MDHSEKSELAIALGSLGADGETQAILSPVLAERVLNFAALKKPIDRRSALIAFSFGNRRLPNGNVTPGPINEALAQCVKGLFSRIEGRIFAQWEIAESLPVESKERPVESILPILEEGTGSVRYLSTVGVLRGVLSKLSSADLPIAIVAHHDHVVRCLRLANLVGFKAAYIPDIVLPTQYDELSAQAWTKTRERYLFHELHCRIELERNRLNGLGLPG